MNFDSSIKNPLQDATDVILNHKVTLQQQKGFDVEKYRNRMLFVINERTLKGTTLRKVGEMIGVSPERVRQIEAKTLRILRQHMKGYK